VSRLASGYRRLAGQGPRGVCEWLLFVLLVPSSWLYAAALRLRAWLYARDRLKSYRAPVPVISVGNLSVGGTGKTPMVDYLVRYVSGLGKRVAVVSRGYGSTQGAGVRVVCAGQGPLLEAGQAGDEPLLLARRNPAALVVVAPRRADGVRRAVALGAEVVLLDDGFQHLAVARDFDLVLLDAARPFGNGRVLPAGLLRESRTALRRGDLFVLTRCRDAQASAPALPGPVLRCRHELAPQAMSLGGETRRLKDLAALRGVAFAGIARPRDFFRGLEAQGLHLAACLSFSDHAAYDGATLARLTRVAAGADFLVTTEKDAVKLAGVRLPLPCFYVPLELVFLEPGQLQERLRPVICPTR
jgi:tetraacyldisaccharide 4'-kinase